MGVVLIPVGRGVLRPEFVVDVGRGPDYMEQMVDPSFFAIDFLFKLGAVAFDGFGARGLGVELFLLLWELEEMLAHGLQIGDYLVWDLVVDDLEHAPVAAGVVDGAEDRGLIRVAEIDDRNGEGFAFDGGDPGLLGLGADELGRETAGGEHRGGDILDSPNLHCGFSCCYNCNQNRGPSL